MAAIPKKWTKESISSLKTARDPLGTLVCCAEDDNAVVEFVPMELVGAGGVFVPMKLVGAGGVLLSCTVEAFQPPAGTPAAEPDVNPDTNEAEGTKPVMHWETEELDAACAVLLMLGVLLGPVTLDCMALLMNAFIC